MSNKLLDFNSTELNDDYWNSYYQLNYFDLFNHEGMCSNTLDSFIDTLPIYNYTDGAQ